MVKSCYTLGMEKLLRFVELTQDFKAVHRKVMLLKEGREENDAEHSFQLALVAWYIIDTEKLGLDANLCMRYALVHDLVEVFAGDTPSSVHKKYSEARLNKHEREERAIQKLLYEYPEFESMHDLIRRYELKEDEESKFVYALDKIMPVMTIFLEKGHAWKISGINLEDILNDKTDKVKASPEIEKYFHLLVDMLKRDEHTLFDTVL
jgi:putative hydrolase of HD superfamily